MLPRQRPYGEVAGSKGEVAEIMDKQKILLIDDDMDMLLIGERILSRAGYKFLSARTSKEGLEKIKAENPDLVLLDYMMPDINGEQFLKTLAFDPEYQKWQHIPIVILTARADGSGELERFFEMGLQAYLIKPFGHRELVNVINNVIGRSQIESRRAKVLYPPKDKQWEGLAEELKISMRSILSLSKMLLQEVDGQINDQQRMDLMAIYNSSRKVLKLLEGKVADSKDKRQFQP